jgi:class 3 adenylate cyclase
MEPRIQYVRAKDGVSIAYWTLGDGQAFVEMPWFPSTHIQLEWQVPEIRTWYERLSVGRRLIRYDARGTGLSDRDVTDYSLDAQVRDLEAVVDGLNLDHFALMALSITGPAAIAYAVRHPERVSHLLLWCAYTRASEFMQTSQANTLATLIDADWEIFTETLAHVGLGWSEGEPARRIAEMFREGSTAQATKAVWDAARDYDVRDLLPQVAAPTLVLHRRQIPWLAMDVARDLASRIPDARLALLEGASMATYLDDMDGVLSTIDEFLGEGEKATHPIAAMESGAFRTVLFTDVEGSTALTQRLGDAKARAVLREHERIVRDALESHGGAEVKTMGDGFMASFSSATRALECAIAMQKAFAEHNGTADEPIKVRIGLNAGEPIAEEEDLFGTAVIMAARIAAQANGGEILTANVLRELTAGKDFLFADRGEATLRGFDDPVQLYEVSWQD